MPELPEVETIVRQLDKVLVGRVIETVEVLREKSAGSDLKEIVGKRVAGVGRAAKNIVVELENKKQKTINNNQKTENRKQKTKKNKQKTKNREQGTEKNDLCLLIHLKMTGQLIFDEQIRNPKSEIINKSKYQNSNTKTKRVVGGHPTRDWVGELPSKHTRIVVRFTDGSKLYFNDQRVFGWWKVVTRDLVNRLISSFPPDVIDEDFSIDYLAGVLKRSGRAVKLVILDQAKMGGMGNIYANDALWLARIHPAKPANKLKKKEIAELHKAMVEVLAKGIELGGASYSHFVDTEGLGGKYQEHFLVYDREGEKCRDCGAVIEKIKLGGRGTYFCPKCQGK